MKVLQSSLDLSAFFQDMAQARSRLLLLDYDGTLAPFHLDRDKAFPYPGVPELLDELLAAGRTRVILISGRPVESLLPLLGLREKPEIWGSHGLERLAADGTYSTPVLEAGVLLGIELAEEWIHDNGLGEWCERKPYGLALHTRAMQEADAKSISQRVDARWSSLARGRGLSVHRFDGGVELRVSGIDKGRAVQTVLDETGGAVVAAYLGDDLTDEDAFRAVKGRGIGVLVRPECRETAADLWIQPPEELLDFLKRWLHASRGES